MSLRDQACYTLELQPSQSDPNILELVEVVGVRKEARYARVRESKEGELYSSALYDYLSGAKLGSVGYGQDKGKKRRLQLHGPDEDISFDFSGRINFEWTFEFQKNKFRWNREVYGKDYVCSMDRKPDPKVEICLARGPSKDDPGRIQILHYNIERFPNEISDLRGLETLLLTSFMSFIDGPEAQPRRTSNPAPVAASAPVASGSKLATPPKLHRPLITEDDYEPENPNEISVSMRSSIDGHIAKATNLLADPSVLFIVVRTREPAAAQRALEVVLGINRFRHKECLGDLKQYVVEEPVVDKVLPSPPGPKRINLDRPKTPPQDLKKGSDGTPSFNIAIYLSTIDLPDLHPSRRRSSAASHASNGKRPIVPSPSPSQNNLQSASKLAVPGQPPMPGSTAPSPSPTGSRPSSTTPDSAQPSKGGFLSSLLSPSKGSNTLQKPQAISTSPPTAPTAHVQAPPPPSPRPLSPQPPSGAKPPPPSSGSKPPKEQSAVARLIAISRR